MELLAIIVVPALAAWGISAGHRCVSVRAQQRLYYSIAILAALLVAAILIGGSTTLAACAIVAVTIVVTELLLALGVIPSGRKFRTLFNHLPLDLRVIASGGREIYRTGIARKLDATTTTRLAAAISKERLDTVLSIRTTSFPNTVFKLYRLRAGFAVLIEDTSVINELQRQLEERRDFLISQNEVLRRRQSMQSLLYRQQRERELGERVEADLASTAAQIASILENQLPSSGPNWERERVRQLNLVKVLVAYSKRKGMLALAGAESDTMHPDQLGTIAHEAMADLRSIGIECAILVAAHGPIGMNAVNTIYDSFYDCVLSVLPQTDPFLMVFIEQRADASLEMRVTIECSIGLDRENAAELIPRVATSTEAWDAVQAQIAQDLEGRLATRGGSYSVNLDDGFVSVTVSTTAPSLPDGGPHALQAGDGA